MSVLKNLEAMFQAGQDDALIRYSLGNEYFKSGELAAAEENLRAAIAHDPNYSAAWKLLGKSLAKAERHDEAIDIYEQGIEVAESRGDIQAAKEMKVFLKRSRKHLAGI